MKHSPGGMPPDLTTWHFACTYFNHACMYFNHACTAFKLLALDQLKISSYGPVCYVSPLHKSSGYNIASMICSLLDYFHEEYY